MGQYFLKKQEGFLLSGEPDLDPPDDPQDCCMEVEEAQHLYLPYDWGDGQEDLLFEWEERHSDQLYDWGD